MSEKLFITRKRKKYKFAKFDEFANCFQLEEWKSLLLNNEPADSLPGGLSKDGESVSDEPRDDGREERPRGVQSAGDILTATLTVEIGAGTALFSVEMAQKHPENFYMAIDIKSDRLYTGAKLANELNLENIVFVRGEITRLMEILPENSANEIWITFPDPYANEDQTRLTSTGARKRLTAPKFLKMYQAVLKLGGKLNFKTDNQPLFDWSSEQLKSENWKINAQSRDLHKSNLSGDCKIMTTYEQRFVKENLPIFYLSATIEK